MDYSELFEEKYQEVFQQLEKFVNSEFRSSKEDDEDERDFLETYNEVKLNLEEWRNQHFEKSSLKSDFEIYQYFTSRNNKANFPEHLFPGVLERKTKTLFLEKRSEAEYPAFIEDLAENKAFKDIIDIANNYYKYFDLVYKDKKWKPIDLTKFDHNYESAEYFLKLHRKIYTQRKVIGSTTKKDYTKEIAQTKQLLSSFEEEEKIFLLKVFHDRILTARKGMDKTELIRFSHVLSGIKDLSIFYKVAGDAQTYTLFHKKYPHFVNLQNGKFYQTLINRLDASKLYSLKAEVKLIESEVLKEINKAGKK
ncbi:hypothetical protein VS868_14305 [Salinimicrobium sp. 3283s]|uniref:hypothetical protein n=1 Tax=Salinimicrobium sp. 3283s TaxID=3114359 RepID=UPI0031ED0CAE